MQHLDEGTIHAWLDGELPSPEREEVEAHVATCERCAAAVAEGRGFIAASSRILTALDTVPGDVLPAASTGTSPAPATVRRRFVASRAWMAAAAVLVLSTVTVLATRPGSESARLQVAAAPSPHREVAQAVTSPEEQAATDKLEEAPQAASSVATGASNNSVTANAPAMSPSRAAAPAQAPKPVDQTERLKSRLEAERKTTLARPDNGAPRVMADAVSPARDSGPAASATRFSKEPATPPAAPADEKVAAKNLGAVTSLDDSMAERRSAINARDVPISGRVTNEAGSPVASASVSVQGMPVATLTHDDGSYSLMVPAARANGKTMSLVARLIGYKAALVPIAPANEPITQDIVLRSNPTALGQVVITGAGTTSPTEKLGTPAGSVEAPRLLWTRTSTHGADTVETTIYSVRDGTVTLIERSSDRGDLRLQESVAESSDQPLAKARADARINSITWTDSSGHTRTLRSTLSREDLERVRIALFGAKP
ncbi:MAG: zf-HC2 domain-containing protein [Gemmatimonadota bacterium]